MTKSKLPAPSSLAISTTNLGLCRKLLIWTSIVSLFVQALLIKNTNEFVGLGLIIVGVIALTTMFYPTGIRKSPLSSALVIGAGSTFFYLPLILKSLMLESYADCLEQPLLVLGYVTPWFVSVRILHYFYVKNHFVDTILEKMRDNLTILGVFQLPSPQQLWVFGIVGISAYIVNVVLGSAESVIVTRITSPLYDYTYAPFLLYVYSMMNTKKVQLKVNTVAIVLFFGSLLFLSMATGFRSYCVNGVFTVGMTLLIGLVIGKYKLPETKIVIRFALILLLLIIPLLHVFKAAQTTVITDRKATLLERFDQFVVQLGKSDIIDEQKAENERVKEFMEAHGSKHWDEEYFENEFLNRLVNLKYHDILMPCVTKLSSAELMMLRYVSTSKIYSILPSPILKILNINFDKVELNRSTMGDYIWANHTKNFYALGGLRTGSIHADLYLHIGKWYWVVFALSTIVFFIACDIFVTTNRMHQFSTPIFSYIALIIAFNCFIMFGSASGKESIFSALAFVIRGTFQTVVYFMIMMWVTSGLNRLSTNAGSSRRSFRQVVKR